jgi:hypothetical protein
MPDQDESESNSLETGGLAGAVQREGFSAKAGLFAWILEDVELHVGLKLNRIEVRVQGLSAAGPPVEGSLETPGTLEVLIAQSSLEEFLTKKAPGGLKEFAVSLRDGKIHVTATLRVLIDMRASAECRLEIHERERLVVVLESAGVLGVTAKNLIQSQIENLNPVFDVKMLPTACVLDEVSIEDGWLRVRGTILAGKF